MGWQGPDSGYTGIKTRGFSVKVENLLIFFSIFLCWNVIQLEYKRKEGRDGSGFSFDRENEAWG